ncbi:MAG: sugar phosphate isomerase/epimerase [Acidobacteriia bacterium]|nr:sugar phosphate isomerase/epimerase [Terriglobia bacterium]
MKLAAFPKCFMDQLVRDRTMTVFDWIEMSADLPIDGLELYEGFLESLDEAYLESVREAIEGRGFVMPMLCCSPDFTQPDPTVRRGEIEREKRWIEATARLGGGFCRVLSGQRRPEVSRADGVERSSDGDALKIYAFTRRPVVASLRLGVEVRLNQRLKQGRGLVEEGDRQISWTRMRR